MAVSAEYLNKVRRAVRRNQNADVDAELTDIIEECRLDLQQLGVLETKTTDETDSLILGAVRSFARWKFGLSNEDAEANRDDYMMMRDEIRRSKNYVYCAITFTVKDGATAKADAYVTFNGETKQTDANGQTVFYYVNTGVNQAYSVRLTGYTTVSAYIDVATDATIAVALTAG